MVKELSAGTGRRKTAVARVRLYSGSGKWLVNGVEIEKHIPSEGPSASTFVNHWNLSALKRNMMLESL